MKFSLIVATVGRTEELSRLLKSLSDQTHRDFQVLVVDQNEDDRVGRVLCQSAGSLSVLHLQSAKGLSRARNAALPHATGDVIAFPDDDCWYEPDLLERVNLLFETHAEWSGITGSPTTGVWPTHSERLKPSNAWRLGISFAIFVRRSAVADVWFDETLGVGAGTPWGACEETDLLLRILKRGAAIQYVPDIRVHHPDVRAEANAQRKSRSYGRGMGRLLRKHRFPLHQVAYHILRPLAASCLALLGGNVKHAATSWACCAGRVEGWAGIE